MMEPTEPFVTPEMRAKIEALRKQYAKKKRWMAELKVNVSAYMEGTIENWPSNIQDGVYAALERTTLGRRYQIQISYCDRDHDTPDQYFIHVIATAEVTIQ